MLNVLYDTNALYHPKILRAIAARADVILWGSKVHVIETISDITDEQTFREARSQMRLMLDVSPTHFLPDADTLVSMALGLAGDSEDVRQWRQVAEILAGTEDYDHLSLNVDAARRQRDEHGHRYLEPVLKQMIPSIRADANTTPERFNIRLSGDELKRFRNYLFSEKGRRAVTRGWIEQRLSRLVLPDRLQKRASDVLEIYYLTYRGFWLNVFERNLKPTANDALDMDLTVALWPADWMFLSGDRKLLEAMRSGGVPAGKFADIRNFDPGNLDDARSA